MIVLERIVTIIQALSAVLIMILVLLQEGKESGSIVTGETNKGGTMGSSKEARLASITKVVGIVFAITTIGATSLMIINY